MKGGCEGLGTQKVAVFGGTFDPVHLGHLLIAQTASTQVELDRVIWVPTRYPPHKSSRSLVEFERRLEMVRQAIVENPAFVVSPVEINRTGSSYAIQTFMELQELYPAIQWYWIVGADAFQTLPKWHCRDILATSVEWLVAPRLLRGGAAGEVGKTCWSDEIYLETQILCQQVANHLAHTSMPVRWQVLQSPLVAVSSSLIRQFCREGRSIRYLVPEAVRIYIETENLYQSATNQ